MSDNKDIIRSEETGVTPSADPQIQSEIKRPTLAQKISKALMSKDYDAIMEGIWRTIISPAMKRMLVDAFHDLVYQGKDNGDNRYGYSDYGYRDYGSYSRTSRDDRGSDAGVRYSFSSIHFKNRKDAENVLHTMQGYLKKKGFILVADYYNIARQRPESTHYNWGWKNLNGSYIYSYNDRGEETWGIHLPEPVPYAMENQ